MKVHLEDGLMGASLFIYPQKLQHHSRADNPIPEVVRDPLQTHILRIFGEEGQVMDIEGSLPELQELVKMMDEVLKGAKE